MSIKRTASELVLFVRRWVKLATLPRGPRRWRAVADQVPVWDSRNELIAQLIAPGSRVLDLGCGAQTLKHHLREPAGYVACDLSPTRPGVIPIDLNKGEWPDVASDFEIVVMSGVLEYLTDPLAALSRVHDFSPTLVTSYQDLRGPVGKAARRARGWMNHFTQAELLQAFGDTGWHVQVRREWSDSFVYVLSAAS